MNRVLLFLALASVLVLGFSGAVLAGDGGCDGKSTKGKCEVTKAAAKEKSGCCASEKTATVVKAAANEKGSCSEKSACSSKAAVTVASTQKKDSGCCASEKGAPVVKAVANQKGSCSEKSACSSKASVACSTKYLPSMAYKVGDKSTHCPKEAKSLATAGHGGVLYVVGDKTYAEEGEAMVALANATDAYLVEFTHVKNGGEGCSEAKVCPMTGKKIESKGAAVYSVAGRSYDCPKTADRASKVASEAMATVTMKYRVGEKETCCSTTAGAMAKKSNAKMMYVVGEECTPCDVTARLMLARFKVEAADRALAAAKLEGTNTSM